MTVLDLLFALSVATLLVLSIFMIICPHYEDGYIGKLALGLAIMIPSAIILWEVLHKTWPGADPVVQILVIGIAIFMLRHAYRFAMYRWAGRFRWKRQQDTSAGLVKG